MMHISGVVTESAIAGREVVRGPGRLGKIQKVKRVSRQTSPRFRPRQRHDGNSDMASAHSAGLEVYLNLQRLGGLPTHIRSIFLQLNTAPR